MPNLPLNFVLIPEILMILQCLILFPDLQILRQWPYRVWRWTKSIKKKSMLNDRVSPLNNASLGEKLSEECWRECFEGWSGGMPSSVGCLQLCSHGNLIPHLSEWKVFLWGFHFVLLMSDRHEAYFSGPEACLDIYKARVMFYSFRLYWIE